MSSLPPKPPPLGTMMTRTLSSGRPNSLAICAIIVDALALRQYFNAIGRWINDGDFRFHKAVLDHLRLENAVGSISRFQQPFDCARSPRLVMLCDKILVSPCTSRTIGFACGMHVDDRVEYVVVNGDLLCHCAGDCFRSAMTSASTLLMNLVVSPSAIICGQSCLIRPTVRSPGKSSAVNTRMTPSIAAAAVVSIFKTRARG